MATLVQWHLMVDDTGLKGLIPTQPRDWGWGRPIKSHSGRESQRGSRASPISRGSSRRQWHTPAGPPPPAGRAVLAGARPASPPHRTATRALHGPTSRPGRRRPRRAGAPGWPWLRDPGLRGRVINSRARGPLAPRPRPPHWQLPPTPDPARPGPGAPTWPQLPPAGGGSGGRGRRGVADRRLPNRPAPRSSRTFSLSTLPFRGS